jgi:branched-subunit amino acid transport protein AzlD
MSDTLYSLLLIAVISAVTLLIRFLPFMLFPAGKETPRYIAYLGKVLPYAIMGMLVVYCLKNVSFVSSPFGLPELLAVGLIVGLHLWKRNTLVSIGAGTACYMLLIQLVFI